jgi:hypothetical protein
MESFLPAPEPESGPQAEQEGEQPEPVHYSTGRLTRAQADLVNAWRARLREDKPLPGRQRVSGVSRLLGYDNRPPASSSDAIAAAVAELLAKHRPEPLDLARYAYAGQQAQREAGGGGDAAARYPPVSYYLPAELSDAAEELRDLAWQAVAKVHGELRAKARERHPGNTPAAATARAMWMAGELARRGLPLGVRQVPRGAIARMAIGRWARRGPDRVAADAVNFAADTHRQPHRARRDMHQLRR